MIYSWITFVPPCQTHGKVHNMFGTQHDILYRTYGWGIGNDFHSLYIFLSWSGFESYSTSHLTSQARTPSLTDPFWTTSKSYQGMYSSKVLSSVLIYLYRSWCPICKQLHQGLSLKKLLSNTPLCFPENSTSFPIDNMSFTYTYQKGCSAPTHFL